MKAHSVWTRIVLVLYLVTVAGVCLYVPTYDLTGLGNRASLLGYNWIWNKEVEGFASVVDCARVVLEVVSLTAIAGVLFLICLFVEGRKQDRAQR
jgi:hypothetical protein